MSRCTSVLYYASRRRHTSFTSDWSSDVCSSDLVWRTALELNGIAARHLRAPALSATEEEVEKIGAVLDAIGLVRSPA